METDRNDIYYRGFDYILSFEPEDIPEFSIEDSLEAYSLLNQDAEAGEMQREERKQLRKRAPGGSCSEYIQFEERGMARSKSIDAETASQSTSHEVVHEISRIVQTVMTMIEEGKLGMGEAAAQEFGLIEKMFVANVIYVRSGVRLDTGLTVEEFVYAANQALRTNKEKRKDDRLRFIYKRAIKVLLSKVSNYHANKTHRMEDYRDQFLEHYFADSMSLNSDALNTTFASNKKLSKLFRSSPLFKKDFINHALNDIVDYYSKYSLGMYLKMHEFFLKQVVGSGNCSHDCLQLKFKRIPWSSKDLKLSLDLIHRLDA